MFKKTEKTYAVLITVYVTAISDVQAVEKTIEVSNIIKELSGYRACTTEIVETGPTIEPRKVDLVKNVNAILAGS